MKKRALILSGGSIRGAFQAGAIKGILEQGFEPDIIHGISAGALNGAFLVNEAAKDTQQIDWSKISKKLEEFWLNEIDKPKKLVRKRNPLILIYETFFKQFKGLLNPEPLLSLIDQYIAQDMLKNSPIEFLVGAVDFFEGDIEYPNQKNPDFLDYVIASASIPLILPYRRINRKPFIDGGIRDVAPLRHVIKKGVEEIVIVLTQPKNMAIRSQNMGNVGPYLERVINLMSNEILLNDLAELQDINQRILAMEGQKIKADSKLAGKRYISHKIIWPDQYYSAEIDDFSSQDIHQMFADGYQQALKTYALSLAA